MSKENIARVVENLPASTEEITVSGGEPFIVRDSLMFTLDKIRKKFDSVELRVQTNGYWMDGLGSSWSTIEELLNYGVDVLEWTGHDDFHKEQGLDVTKVIFTIMDIEKKLEERYGKSSLRIDGRGCNMQKAVRFGRAEMLPEEETSETTPCHIFFKKISSPHGEREDDGVDLTIDNEGNVFLCCWKMPVSLGSAIEEPIEEIYRRAMENPVINTLVVEGLGKAAKVMGIYKKKDERKYFYNSCMMCKKIFKNFKIE